jgi:hypothetical protein
MVSERKRRRGEGNEEGGGGGEGESVWRIGLVSDTHGVFDEKLKALFAGCDEIWHAGESGEE